MTAARSQGPQPRPLLPQTPAAPSPTSQECLAFPWPAPPPPPQLALSGLKRQAMSLSSTAATMGKSQAPHASHFSSELLTSGYPQLTPLTLFIFPGQQWPRKAHPTPTCPSTREKKKKIPRDYSSTKPTRLAESLWGTQACSLPLSPQCFCI